MDAPDSCCDPEWWIREYVLIYLGVIARPLSGIILSACIFAAAFFLIPKRGIS